MNQIELTSAELKYFKTKGIARVVDGVVETNSPELQSYSHEGAARGEYPRCPFGGPGEEIKITCQDIPVESHFVLRDVHIAWANYGEFFWILRIMPMPQAVCVVVATDDMATQVVAVTRKNPPLRWGLPGGKRDPEDQDIFDAAIRELREETGIQAVRGEIWQIYSDVCPGQMTYFSYTFILKRSVSIPDTGFLNDEGCRVAPVTWDVLTNPEVSPFAEYNKGVRRRVQSLMGK